VEEAQAAAVSVGREHRPRSAIVEEVGTSLLCSLEETGTTPVWKRQGRVIRAAWAAGLKRRFGYECRKRSARAARESKRTGRSSRGRPNIRTLVLPILDSIPKTEKVLELLNIYPKQTTRGCNTEQAPDRYEVKLKHN
jgi:hypothetical protein